MSNIKEYFILRGIKTVMECNRQLNNTKIAGKMPTGFRYRIY